MRTPILPHLPSAPLVTVSRAAGGGFVQVVGESFRTRQVSLGHADTDRHRQQHRLAGAALTMGFTGR